MIERESQIALLEDQLETQKEEHDRLRHKVSIGRGVGHCPSSSPHPTAPPSSPRPTTWARTSARPLPCRSDPRGWGSYIFYVCAISPKFSELPRVPQVPRKCAAL